MKKILIVEDSTEINNMICDYLSKKLFECTHFGFDVAGNKW